MDTFFVQLNIYRWATKRGKYSRNGRKRNILNEVSGKEIEYGKRKKRLGNDKT
jgi:hypothetical protein